MSICQEKSLKVVLKNLMLRQVASRVFKSGCEGPRHIMFAVADHYEPFHGGADFKKASARVKAWTEEYTECVSRFSDNDGVVPQHTWFYPPHHDICFLKDLVEICAKGFGEVEMHLHHNHMPPFPDTSESLKSKILRCIDDYSKLGIFCLPDGSKRFGFVHGDWSLDNSRGDKFCGVNDEITILRDCGCYADFTFPSLGPAQPDTVNKFFYVKDDPVLPKSYSKGKEMVVGGTSWGDLLMITGILGLRFKSRTHMLKPSIEISNLDKADLPFKERIDFWIDNAVTIKGNSNWLFVKLHTHGANETAWESLFGKPAYDMYEYLSEKYNDGKKYIIHYVSAREMYNIAKAAEAGEQGDPGKFRDYIIPRYIYLKD